MNTFNLTRVAQEIQLECVEIFKGSTGSGQESNWLARPYSLLSFIRCGTVETCLGMGASTKILRKKGSILYCPPNVPRRNRILEPMEFTAILLAFEIPSGVGLEFFWEIPFVLEDNGLSELAERLYELRGRTEVNCVLERREILLHLLRLILGQSIPRKGNSTVFLPGRLAPALSVIASSYREKLEIRNLAAMCGLSVQQFQILFRKQLRMTPSAFLRAKRLREAERLIVLSDMTLGEIADKTGFYDAFELSRRFKAAYGVSPSHYKRNVP